MKKLFAHEKIMKNIRMNEDAKEILTEIEIKGRLNGYSVQDFLAALEDIWRDNV